MLRRAEERGEAGARIEAGKQSQSMLPSFPTRAAL